VLWWARV